MAIRIARITNEDLRMTEDIIRHAAHLGIEITYSKGLARLAEVFTELLDRRAHVSAEASLAYEGAKLMIDIHAAHLPGDEHNFDGWYDLENIDESIEDLGREVRYLDSRGLIEHHPNHPNLVAIRDESEEDTKEQTSLSEMAIMVQGRRGTGGFDA